MEELSLKNNLEEDLKVKINLLFEVDKKTNEKLGEFYKKLKTKYEDIIIPNKEDGLPFHFTIIGGGNIEESELREFVEEGKGKLKNSLDKLKMFNEEKRIPKPDDRSQLSWHAFPFGRERILILRLKFTDKDYVLSGDKKLNKEIAKDLGNPNMDFSLPSHITICKFSPPENLFVDFDTLLQNAQNLFENMSIKENIELFPTVYVKNTKEKQFYKLNIEN
ncbi:hypothetical protein SDC9_07788 [bioreactor metagenome]|uniref:Uncharacterized protein n=1 Tax=bioreactor metagenome TaxID=1076179 RepID=A0A644T5U9_9ZZZZ|nr:hypothetical protein [Candidatus Elulimicrobiales bacterium]